MNAPIHFFGRITAIVLLVGCIAVFAGSADLWNDRAPTFFADASLPSRSSLAAHASTSVFAAANLEEASTARPEAATLPGDTATGNTEAPARTATIVHDVHPIQVVASTRVASAQLNDSIMTAAANVSDGSLATAWSVPSDDSERAVTLMFDGPVKLRELHLATGFAPAPAASAGTHGAQVLRAKMVRLEFTNAAIDMPLDDVATLQSIKLDAIVTSFVRVVIVKTQPAQPDQGRPFTAINEIVPVGEVCAPQACGEVAETIRAIATLRGGWGGDTIIEKIDGDYARVRALAPSAVASPAIVVLKRQAGAWAVVSMGQSFTAEKLRQLGTPPSILE